MSTVSSGHSKRMEKAVAFFYENAGYCYDPKTETPEQGHTRCAEALANAEYESSGMSFQWEVDPYTDSSDFSNKKPAWQLWTCVARNEDGEVVASLGGIDFGRDKDPWGDTYRRVVEAELALEALSDVPDWVHAQ